MHYAERNSRNLALVRTFLEAQGYNVSCYWIDYSESASDPTCAYWLAEHKDDTKRNVDFVYSHTAQPNDSEEKEIERQLAFNTWFLEFKASVPAADHAMSGAILRLVDKIRELAPDAALPEGWINPIEALAEKMRTNIIEGPKKF